MQCEDIELGEEDPEVVPGSLGDVHEPDKEDGSPGLKVTVMTVTGKKVELSVQFNTTVVEL